MFYEYVFIPKGILGALVSPQILKGLRIKDAMILFRVLSGIFGLISAFTEHLGNIYIDKQDNCFFFSCYWNFQMPYLFHQFHIGARLSADLF